MNAFSEAYVPFYDSINDVIITANPLPYTVKFIFVGVRNNKSQQIRR